MKQCPRCEASYDSPRARRCARDGAMLVPAHDPLTDVALPDAGIHVESRIADGAGTVLYRARRLDAEGPHLALKLPMRERRDDPSTLDRIARTARLGETLAGIYLATVLRAATMPDGRRGVLMALYDEPTLAACIRDEALTTREARDLAADVARGLASAHEVGVVHGALYPEDVRITSRGDRLGAVVAGFGRADPTQGIRAWRARRPEAEGYLSPALRAGAVATPLDDIFALGAMLYESLTGLNPRTVATRPPPSAVNPALPDALSGLVLAMLSPIPAQRPRTAREVERALDAIALGDDTHNRPLREASLAGWRARYEALSLRAEQRNADALTDRGAQPYRGGHNPTDPVRAELGRFESLLRELDDAHTARAHARARREEEPDPEDPAVIARRDEADALASLAAREDALLRRISECEPDLAPAERRARAAEDVLRSACGRLAGLTPEGESARVLADAAREAAAAGEAWERCDDAVHRTRRALGELWAELDSVRNALSLKRTAHPLGPDGEPVPAAPDEPTSARNFAQACEALSLSDTALRELLEPPA